MGSKLWTWRVERKQRDLDQASAEREGEGGRIPRCGRLKGEEGDGSVMG